MNKDELEQIAQRPSCCKPFGASVTLSVGERDELVAMARDGMNLAQAAREALGFISAAEQDYPSANLRIAEEILALAVAPFNDARAKEEA